MICMVLHFVRSVFWISGVLNDMFVSGHNGLARPLFIHSGHVFIITCKPQSASLMPLGNTACFLNKLLITFPVFPYCSLSAKILPVFSENCIFELVQVLNPYVVSIAKWYITSPIYRQCITNYYSTTILSVFVHKHQKCM